MQQKFESIGLMNSLCKKQGMSCTEIYGSVFSLSDQKVQVIDPKIESVSQKRGMKIHV